MVFARAKLMLEDNCFEEEPGEVAMKLIAPNVTKAYERVYEAMRAVFHVPESQIQETAYSWAKTKDGDKFSVTWWLHKDMDIFSYMFVRFKMNGQGNDKTGKLSLSIRGLLRSEYPQDTVWQRSLFYEMIRTFWHRMFYRRKREEYAEECRHGVILFHKKMKEFFEELKKGD
jgi:hypothetical protein